jgi:hypothetical protein
MGTPFLSVSLRNDLINCKQCKTWLRGWSLDGGSTIISLMFFWIYNGSVSSRITFKIATETYRCIYNCAPVYLSELISRRKFRSSLDLILPKTKLVNYGDRSFAKMAPKIWNSIPLPIRTANSLSQFRSMLKTDLFKLEYPNAKWYVYFAVLFRWSHSAFDHACKRRSINQCIIIITLLLLLKTKLTRGHYLRKLVLSL